MEETTLQSGLREWVKNAARLEDSKVIWAEQDAVRLPPPFITLRLGTLSPLSSLDEVQSETDLTKPAGEEVTLTVVGHRSLPVTLQAFGKTAVSLLSRVQASLALPSVQEKLDAAGLSSYDIGQVQNTTALFETVYEPRALLEVSFYVTETVTESTTFIEDVEVEDQINDTTFTIDTEP